MQIIQVLDACKLLKKKIDKAKPDIKMLCEQSALVCQMAIKAATDHLDAMKKPRYPHDEGSFLESSVLKPVT